MNDEVELREYFNWLKDNLDDYDSGSLADKIVNCSVDFFREIKDFVDIQYIFTYYYMKYYKSVRCQPTGIDMEKEIKTFEEYLTEQFYDKREIWYEFVRP